MLEIIQKVRKDATATFGMQIEALNATLNNPNIDSSDREEARLKLTNIELAIKDIVEDSTKRERALLKEVAVRLNMLGFDESAGSKKISK